MPREYDYHCTQCGARPGRDNEESKELLVAVVTVFKNIGYGGRTIRSRVTAWLCATCLAKHPAWNLGDRTFIDQVARDKAHEPGEQTADAGAQSLQAQGSNPTRTGMA